MVRTTKVRRSVATQGIKKQTATSRSGKQDIFEHLEKLIPKQYVAYLYKLSEWCFHLIIDTCCNFNIIPISVDCDGRLTARKTSRERAIHYFGLTLQMVRMLHMFAMTAQPLVDGILDLTTFISLGSALDYIVGFSVSSSVLFRPYETAQLVNTTPVILSFYPKDGKITTMFQISKNAILIIAFTLMTGSYTLLMSVLGFLVDDCPVSSYHVVESMTGRPLFIPPVLWKMFFWPLEFFIFLHIFTLATSGTMTLATMPNIVLVCKQEMR